MTQNDYVKMLDTELIKKMDALVMMNESGPNMLEATKLLSASKMISKTAYYYLAILSPGYNEGQLNESVRSILNEGKGDLFCDYLLLIDQYQKNRLIIPVTTLMQSLYPIVEALTLHAKKGISEAIYLLADLELSDIPGVSDNSHGIDLLLGLANAGHRIAEYRFSSYVLHNPEYAKYYGKVKPFLQKSSAQGYSPATILLLNLCRNGFDRYIPQDPKEAARIEEIFAPSDAELSEAIGKRYLAGDSEKEPNFEKALHFFDLAISLGHEIKLETYTQALLGYYQKLKMNGDERTNVVKEKLINDLRELVKEGDSKAAADLSTILFESDPDKNKDEIKELAISSFKATGDPEAAYRLFVLTSKEPNSLERNRNLAIYAEKAYPVYGKKVYDIFRYHYFNVKTKADKYASALVLLKTVKTQAPLFYATERVSIAIALGDRKTAIRYLREAEPYLQNADQYSYTLAELFLKLGNSNSDSEKAINLYKQASDKGSKEAAYRLGSIYYEGKIVPKNLELASIYLKRASDLGLHNADYALSMIAFALNNQHLGLEWLLNGEAYGNVQCEKTLGELYYKGQYVTKDYPMAAKYLSEAAKDGDSQSCFTLAKIVYYGLGFEPDKEKGIRLFNEAVKMGYPIPEGEYGKILIENNDLKGIDYLVIASKKGDNDASLYLADLYYEGGIIHKDFPLAHKYYLLAANDDFMKAYYRLGIMSKTGLGCAKNEKKAFSYFEKAALLGDPSAGYEAGLAAFNLRDYETANKYLLNNQFDDVPEIYYDLAYMNLYAKIAKASHEDGKFYAEKAESLGYLQAKKLRR